jgi:2'-5' RNA ligase
MKVDTDELERGTKEEMEHTKDLNVAREIALDHLRENPAYYTQLRKSGLSESEIIPPLQSYAGINVVRATVQYQELPEFVLVDEIPPNVHRQLLSIMGNHALDIYDGAMTFPYNKAPGVLQFLQTMGVQVKVTKKTHAETDLVCVTTIKEPVESAKEKQTGVMVCLYPPREVAEQFAVDGGEPVENLHVTLAYLGKGEDLPEDVVERAVQACKVVAAKQTVLNGEIGGIGRWAAGDDKDVVYASVDCPGSNEFRDALNRALVDGGIPPKSNHGWTAHMTIQYVDDHDADVKIHHVDPVPVSFVSVWVVRGDNERVEVKFGKNSAEAFNVLQRRSLDRQRSERDLQTIIENADQGHVSDRNAERTKQRTGLDPKNAKDRQELKKQISISPPSGATAELDRQIAEKLGWW